MKEELQYIDMKTEYHSCYLEFVKWQQEKDPNWKPCWTGNQVEFVNELMFWIENISKLKKDLTQFVV